MVCGTASHKFQYSFEKAVHIYIGRNACTGDLLILEQLKTAVSETVSEPFVEMVGCLDRSNATPSYPDPERGTSGGERGVCGSESRLVGVLS